MIKVPIHSYSSTRRIHQLITKRELDAQGTSWGRVAHANVTGLACALLDTVIRDSPAIDGRPIPLGEGISKEEPKRHTV
jgi:hypothetical protein